MAYQSWDELVGMSAKDPRLKLLGNNQAAQPSQVSSMGTAQPGSMAKQGSQVKPDGAMMAAIQKRMKKNQLNQLDPTASTNTSSSTPNTY